MKDYTFCLFSAKKSSKPDVVLTICGGAEGTINHADRREVAAFMTAITDQAEGLDITEYDEPQALLVIGPNGSSGSFKVDQEIHQLLYISLITLCESRISDAEGNNTNGFLSVSSVSVTSTKKEEKGQLTIDSLIESFKKNRDNTIN